MEGGNNGNVSGEGFQNVNGRADMRMDDDVKVDEGTPAPVPLRKFGGIPTHPSSNLGGGSDRPSPVDDTDHQQDRPPKRAKTAGDLEKLVAEAGGVKEDELAAGSMTAKLKDAAAQHERREAPPASAPIPAPAPAPAFSLFPTMGINTAAVQAAAVQAELQRKQQEEAIQLQQQMYVAAQYRAHYTSYNQQLMAQAQPSVPDPAPAPAPPKKRGGVEEEVVVEDDESEEEFDSQDDDYEEDKRQRSSGALLKRARQIANKLRRTLGNSALQDDRVCAAGEDELGEGAQLVSRDDLATAGVAAADLKPYQLIGVNFLSLIHTSRAVKGAILADEMGLGKTCQAICFLGMLSAKESGVLAGGQPAGGAAGGTPAPFNPGLRSLYLIVCPASLLDNWKREIERWCPALGEPLVLHGATRLDAQQILRNYAVKFEKLKPSGQRREKEEEEDQLDSEDEALEVPENEAFRVVLTTYSVFERDSDATRIDRQVLRRIQWGSIVLDEAHALKNARSTRTAQLRKVSDWAEFRVLVTGTPLQNDLGELQSLLSVIDPKLFKDEALADEGAPVADRVAIAKALMGPLVLRRLKAEVASQLVGKTRTKRAVPMAEMQRLLYDFAVAQLRGHRAQADALFASLKDATRRIGGGGLLNGGDDAIVVVEDDPPRPPGLAVPKPPASAAPLGAPFIGGKTSGLLCGKKDAAHSFTTLRKIALHPLLVRHIYDDDTVMQISQILYNAQHFGPQATIKMVEDEVKNWSDFQLWGTCESVAALHRWRLPEGLLLESSGKLQALLALIEELGKKGSRPLIFSQWTNVLDIIERALLHKGITYRRLDGSTDVSTRQEIVDNYNRDMTVTAFLLTTKAGGVGLNLTGADTVIIFDSSFNPQDDKQAEDRAHRLGQTRHVTCYRLVTAGTVDESIVHIAERKLHLEEMLMGTGNGATAEEDGVAPSDAKLLKAKESEHVKEILKRLING